MPALRPRLSKCPLSPLLKPRLKCPLQRHQSTSSGAPPDSQITRVLNRLPKFLHPYTNGLRTAPVSHVVSFLILHELTAIVPLVGLTALFHYSEWLPKGWTEARYVRDGIDKFGRYFRRKGWFGFDKEHPLEEIRIEGGTTKEASNGTRILIEVATAYAITKVFLPARILLSVWATPWFARVGIGRFGKLFGRAKPSTSGNAAGTGATGGGVSSTTKGK